MTPAEEVLADYRTTGLSLLAHPLQFLRGELEKLRVIPASGLKTWPNGKWVRVAGLVLVRQRPSTAKGITFVTLEDETSTANLIIRPERLEALPHRRPRRHDSHRRRPFAAAGSRIFTSSSPSWRIFPSISTACSRNRGTFAETPAGSRFVDLVQMLDSVPAGLAPAGAKDWPLRRNPQSVFAVFSSSPAARP